MYVMLLHCVHRPPTEKKLVALYTSTAVIPNTAARRQCLTTNIIMGPFDQLAFSIYMVVIRGRTPRCNMANLKRTWSLCTQEGLNTTVLRLRQVYTNENTIVIVIDSLV